MAPDLPVVGAPVTVYVDSMQAAYRRMVMCHMIGNTEAELHAMADTIGVARRWYQGDHYDIALTKRAKAVAAGAVEITWRQAGAMMWFHRRGLSMPAPSSAVDAMLEAMRRKSQPA